MTFPHCRTTLGADGVTAPVDVYTVCVDGAGLASGAPVCTMAPSSANSAEVGNLVTTQDVVTLSAVVTCTNTEGVSASLRSSRDLLFVKTPPSVQRPTLVQVSSHDCSSSPPPPPTPPPSYTPVSWHPSILVMFWLAFSVVPCFPSQFPPLLPDGLVVTSRYLRDGNGQVIISCVVGEPRGAVRVVSVWISLAQVCATAARGPVCLVAFALALAPSSAHA